jgi:hypothetical protein
MRISRVTSVAPGSPAAKPTGYLPRSLLFPRSRMASRSLAKAPRAHLFAAEKLFRLLTAQRCQLRQETGLAARAGVNGYRAGRPRNRPARPRIQYMPVTNAIDHDVTIGVPAGGYGSMSQFEQARAGPRLLRMLR